MSYFLSDNLRVLQSDSSTTSETSTSSNKTLIIIISAAAALVLILGVVVVFLLIRKKKKKAEEEELKKKQFDEKSVMSVVSKHFKRSMSRMGDPNSPEVRGLNRHETGVTSKKKTTTYENNYEENNESQQEGEERVYEFNPDEVHHEEPENEEKSIEEGDIVLKEKQKKIPHRVTFTDDVLAKHQNEKKIEEESKKTNAANEIIALFTEKLKGLKQKKKQKSILEEIEKMKKKKEKRKKGIDNDPTEDRSSVHILNTDISHISQVSARSVIKKENHANIVCYTDENREEPEEAFYNQKFEDLQEEKRQIEMEEKEAIKKEKEIEEKFKMQKMSKNHTKDDSHEDYSNLYKYNEDPEVEAYKTKETLKVKSQALMTDFSQPKNVEVLKEGEESSVQS
jgi:hypothetical protein